MGDKATERLFFGFEVDSPWPERLPFGRLLEPRHRHMTLAFLGDVEREKLTEKLTSFPRLGRPIGFVGQFDRLFFLPRSHPRVVAWHVDWLEPATSLLLFHETLLNWLEEEGYTPDRRHPFTPHVTLARSPFSFHEWKKQFRPSVCMIKAIHLYRSEGNLHYRSMWNTSFDAPFEEIDHTADQAFLVRGTDMQMLFLHARAALAWSFPELLPYFGEEQISDHNECIIALNQLISRADQEVGVPLKAVSFHGEIVQKKEHLIEWEMIIDV